MQTFSLDWNYLSTKENQMHLPASQNQQASAYKEEKQNSFLSYMYLFLILCAFKMVGVRQDAVRSTDWKH